MPVSKKRKKTTSKRRFGSTKYIPEVINLAFKYIHAHYEPKNDEFHIYLNLVCNDAPIIVSGYIDPDKSYFNGIRIHNPKPKKGHTAQTVYITRKDAPNFFANVKAYVDTVGDLLDANEQIPVLDIQNDGAYFNDKTLGDYRKLIYPQEMQVL